MIGKVLNGISTFDEVSTYPYSDPGYLMRQVCLENGLNV